MDMLSPAWMTLYLAFLHLQINILLWIIRSHSGPIYSFVIVEVENGCEGCKAAMMSAANGLLKVARYSCEPAMHVQQ
jgi:hypothetical protein